ncbi:MAG: RNA polymerase factor sigma-54 [Bacteroidota bacterium]
MRNSQSQVQTQKQGLNTFLLQQKLQVLHLMHLPSLALEEYLKNQLEENPVLEATEDEEKQEEVFSNEDKVAAEVSNKLNEVAEYFDDDEVPDYKTYVNNLSKDEPVFTATAVYYQSFQEQLKDQLKVMELLPQTKHLVEYIIDSLDEDGYLHTPLSDLGDDIGFSLGHMVSDETMTEALGIVQQFDPPGIGARSLQECLAIQLRRKKNKDEDHLRAEKIVELYFSELYHKNYDKIKREMFLDEDELKLALRVIGHLTPKPVFVAPKDLSVAQSIIPEFIVTIEDDKLEVSLANNPGAGISINKEYVDLITKEKAPLKKKTEFNYFRKKVDEAKWLLEALQQREYTLMEIMKVIAGMQRDFFMSGERINLKPMILEDVADRTGYDISTVSRVTCNKYAQTPYGNILLKELFSTTLHSTDGGVVSTEKVKQTIVELLEKEDKSKPFTDFEIVNQLNKMGFEIARRTVVKYREGLHLPNARMRKTIV